MLIGRPLSKAVGWVAARRLGEARPSISPARSAAILEMAMLRIVFHDGRALPSLREFADFAGRAASPRPAKRSESLAFSPYLPPARSAGRCFSAEHRFFIVGANCVRPSVFAVAGRRPWLRPAESTKDRIRGALQDTDVRRQPVGWAKPDRPSFRREAPLTFPSPLAGERLGRGGTISKIMTNDN
jgi:hypothetical protein